MLNAIYWIVVIRSAQLTTSTQKGKDSFASETFMGVPTLAKN